MPAVFMKNVLWFFLLLLAQMTLAQSPSDTSLDARISYFLDKAKDTGFTALDRHELSMLSFQVQNKGFLLEEQNGDFAGALPHIDRALSIWKTLDDTANVANLLKYRGYLLGNLGRFPEAKTDVFRSIALYRSLRWGFGVAVARFDLAKIYEAEKKTDSAFVILEESMHYWKTVKDTFRLVTTNTFLMHLYLDGRDYPQAEKVFLENRCMLEKAKLHWRPLIDYYYVSYQLFKALEDKKMAGRYLSSYTRKIDQLRVDGITARSGYQRE